jgi:hypothetical protein
VISTSTITVKAPVHVAGTVTVTVTTPGGTSNAKAYTYLPLPVLTSITPAAGKTAGGTTVTLMGSGFVAGAMVDFGAGNPGSTLDVVSTGKITVKAPVHASATVTVTVITTGGTSNAKPYSYVAAPILTSVTPSMGPATGGTTVILHGSNLAAVAHVTFGGKTATFTVTSTSAISVAVPIATLIPTVNISVTSPGGTSNAVLFHYTFPAPTLTSITPSSGPSAGGTTVVIHGTHLQFVTYVTVGGSRAAILNFTATSITVKVPGGFPGTVATVFVTGPGGVSNSLTYTFTT